MLSTGTDLQSGGRVTNLLPTRIHMHRQWLRLSTTPVRSHPREPSLLPEAYIAYTEPADGCADGKRAVGNRPADMLLRGTKSLTGR